MTTTLKQLCNSVIESAAKATKVQKWYAHSAGDSCEEATVRGPFCRWFRVSEVNPNYKKHVADTYDDAKFIAIAMNNVEKLARALLVMEEALQRYANQPLHSVTDILPDGKPSKQMTAIWVNGMEELADVALAKAEEMLGER